VIFGLINIVIIYCYETPGKKKEQSLDLSAHDSQLLGCSKVCSVLTIGKKTALQLDCVSRSHVYEACHVTVNFS
jgi:hypothetical protein